MAARHLGEEVGRRRRDDDQVGLARQADMADLVLVVEIEQIGEHPVVAERGDRQRRHELLRRARHHRAHRHAVLAQAAHEVEALVGGNAAADDEQDAVLSHVKHCRTRSSKALSLAHLAGARG